MHEGSCRGAYAWQGRPRGVQMAALLGGLVPLVDATTPSLGAGRGRRHRSSRVPLFLVFSVSHFSCPGLSEVVLVGDQDLPSMGYDIRPLLRVVGLGRSSPPFCVTQVREGRGVSLQRLGSAMARHWKHRIGGVRTVRNRPCGARRAKTRQTGTLDDGRKKRPFNYSKLDSTRRNIRIAQQRIFSMQD